MQPVGTVVILLTIASNLGIAVADFVRARFVLANSAEVGVPPSWLPILGALKAAGAAGLALALLGLQPVGVAAATGLVLFFIAAIAAHLRARVHHNIAFPATYLALASGSLVFLVMQ